MIKYFKNIDHETVEISEPENDSWVNVVPPLKQEEFYELSEKLEIPIDFLTDSLDIDERSRFEEDDNVKLLVIKTPTDNNSFNESDADYITIPIIIILTHNHIVTVNSFENPAIKKFLTTFQNRQPDKKSLMVVKIIEKIIQNFMEYLKEINRKRGIIERNFYTDHKNEHLQELMRLQKSLVYFVAALRSNELLLAKLQRTGFLSLTEEETESLEDLMVDNSQALEMANIYTNILNSSMTTFGHVIANNQNLYLKKLVIVIILLSIPLLTACIFSMNVYNGLEGAAYPFYIIASFSFLVILVLALLAFRKKLF
ncbi:magnesium transporter CorA [Niabella ginsenosidivorans]|uniref:Magnesium transporter CorA n=1 Tax=Niabella ginsenosidivorans TaxID=1176587 RepID=A0A1A9I444_9BACT|nr:magnesium transporter CorA family protein [Niabella ginsenosidivorans]ANH81451.1 magnesium transporter CorA [Niabella ginsenosidivorans]